MPYLNKVAGSDGVRVVSSGDNDFEVEPGEVEDQNKAQQVHNDADE